MAFLTRWLEKRRTPQLAPAWVTEDIAVSRAPRPEEWPSLAQQGISLVVTLCNDDEYTAPGIDDMAGITHECFPVEDHDVLPADKLTELATRIAEAVRSGDNVLIHCREGRGRSPMVACAVLVELGYSLPLAFDLVRRARPNLVFSDVQTQALEAYAAQTHR
jgi:protein-tyrosine phosphatase